MNPQETPQNVQNPVPPAVPVPQVTPPAAGQPAPVVPPTAVSPVGGSKSKLGMILGLVGGLIVLIIIVLLLGWFMLWSPAAQAKRLSASFMHSMTTGDVAKATELTGDSTAKDFLTTSAPKVKGTYKLAQSKFTNDTGYYLYDLSGAPDKYARTIIQKDNGKRVVHSFVFGNQALALVPAVASASTSDSKSADSTTTTTSTDTTPAKTGAGECLGANDFVALNPYPVDATSDGLYVWYDDVFFNADVTTYAYPDLMSDLYSGYTKFYQQNSAKQFTITLTGEVNSTSPDDSLANQRAAIVQSALVAAGVPASRITVAAPTNYGTSLGAGDDGSQNRNVEIQIASPDSCGNGTNQ